MDAAHVHLLLNHVPVIGLVFAFLLLAYGLARRSDDVMKAALWTLGLVGLAAVVVYLTGEPAEELVEGLPGFSEPAMERHEEAALWATVAAAAVGALALGGLYAFRRRSLSRGFGATALLLTLLAGLPMGWTANLGGQVRHEEIRGGEPGAAAPDARDGEQEGDADERDPEVEPEEAAAPEATLPEASPPEEDRRQAIAVPEAARRTILWEMRQMLRALHGVLRASVAFDRAAIREAALSGGTRIAVDTDPALAQRLPEDFVELGSGTHRDFDALAEAVEGGASRDTVLARLSALTAKCVTCHASYRLALDGSGGPGADTAR